MHSFNTLVCEAGLTKVNYNSSYANGIEIAEQNVLFHHNHIHCNFTIISLSKITIYCVKGLANSSVWRRS